MADGGAPLVRRQCEACWRDVLVGRERGRHGNPAVVLDPQWLTQRDEVAAVVEGRATWLIGDEGLSRRTVARGLWPVPPGVMFAEHVCALHSVAGVGSADDHVAGYAGGMAT